MKTDIPKSFTYTVRKSSTPAVDNRSTITPLINSVELEQIGLTVTLLLTVDFSTHHHGHVILQSELAVTVHTTERILTFLYDECELG